MDISKYIAKLNNFGLPIKTLWIKVNSSVSKTLLVNQDYICTPVKNNTFWCI